MVVFVCGHFICGFPRNGCRSCWWLSLRTANFVDCWSWSSDKTASYTFSNVAKQLCLVQPDTWVMQVTGLSLIQITFTVVSLVQNRLLCDPATSHLGSSLRGWCRCSRPCTLSGRTPRTPATHTMLRRALGVLPVNIRVAAPFIFNTANGCGETRPNQALRCWSR